MKTKKLIVAAAVAVAGVVLARRRRAGDADGGDPEFWGPKRERASWDDVDKAA